MGFIDPNKASVSEFGGRQGPAEIFNEDGVSIIRGEIFSDELSLETKGFVKDALGVFAHLEVVNQNWIIRMRSIAYPVRSPLDIPRINGDVDPILVAVLRQQHGNMVVFDSADLVAQRDEHITVTNNASGMTVVRLERRG
jgi:hypothetical protein